MANQTFNEKLARVYREMAEKVNDLDALNQAFVQILENKQKNETLDCVSLKKIAYTLIERNQLGEIKRGKQRAIIIDSEIESLSDDEIESIIDCTPDRPESRQNPLQSV